MPVYGLEKTATFIRTTLRHPAFCRAWNYIVKAGLTNEEKSAIVLVPVQRISFREWLEKNIATRTGDNNFDEFLEHSVEAADRSLVTALFGYLGLLSEAPVPSNSNLFCRCIAIYPGK